MRTLRMIRRTLGKERAQRSDLEPTLPDAVDDRGNRRGGRAAIALPLRIRVMKEDDRARCRPFDHVARNPFGRTAPPVESGDRPLNGVKPKRARSAEVSGRPHAVWRTGPRRPDAGHAVEHVLGTRKLVERLLKRARQIQGMRIRMVANLMAFPDNAARDVGVALHLPPDHEEGAFDLALPE